MNDSTSKEQGQRDAELKRLDGELRGSSNQAEFVKKMSMNDLKDLIESYDEAKKELKRQVLDARKDPKNAEQDHPNQRSIDEQAVEIRELRFKVKARFDHLSKLESELRGSADMGGYIETLDPADRTVLVGKFERDAEVGEKLDVTVDEKLAALKAKAILAAIEGAQPDIETRLREEERKLRVALGADYFVIEGETVPPVEFLDAVSSCSLEVLMQLEERLEKQIAKLGEELNVDQTVEMGHQNLWRGQTAVILDRIKTVLGPRQLDAERQIDDDIELTEIVVGGEELFNADRPYDEEQAVESSGRPTDLSGVSDIELKRMASHYLKAKATHGADVVAAQMPIMKARYDIVKAEQDRRLTKLLGELREAQSTNEFIKRMTNDQVDGLAVKLHVEVGASKSKHRSGSEEGAALLRRSDETDDRTLLGVLKAEQRERKARDNAKEKGMTTTRTDAPRR